MNVLILAPGQVTALQQLNAANPSPHQLQPAPLADGRPALNADLLHDCGPGQTWESYREFLETLAVQLDASFPQADIQ